MRKSSVVLQAKDLVEQGLLLLGSQSWKFETLPTGIRALDRLLEGGIPKGQVTELYGPFGCGKSTIAYHTIAASMGQCPKVDIGLMNGKRESRPVRVVVLDTEGTFDRVRAEALGVVTKEIAIFHPRNGEEGFQLIEDWTRLGVRFFVVDSLRGMVPRPIVDGTMDDKFMGKQAALFAQFFSKYLLMPERATLLCVNQVTQRMNVTAWQDPYTTPGGENAKHSYCLRLDCRRRLKLKKGKDIVGQEVTATITKSKYCSPYRRALMFLVFDRGYVSQKVWDRIRLSRGHKLDEGD